MHRKIRSFLTNHLLKRKISTEQLQPFESIPGPRPLPIIGNVWRYLPIIGDYKPDSLLENARFNEQKYGPIVREQLTKDHTILHLFDPADIRRLVSYDGKCPHRRSHRALLKYRRDNPELYLDGGLFPENGLSWSRQRNQFRARMFCKSQLASNADKIDKMSSLMLARIGCGEVKDFENHLYRWALGNSLSLFLDLDINDLSDDSVTEIMQHLHSTLEAIDKTEIQTEKWLKHPSKCPHFMKLVKSQEYLYDFVARNVDQCEENGIGASYLRDWLYKDKLDRRDVISFVIDSLQAGLHTTSYTAAFLFYHVTKDERVLKKLRLEIQDPLDAERIEKLAFLRGCLKETMRLNPVSIGTGRLTVHDDLVIRNYKIPKGVMVITQNQAISLNPVFFTEPELFRPERWSKDLPIEKRPQAYTTLPFGFGARKCIGKNIAEFQIKMLAAKLLYHYDITFSSEIRTKTTLIHSISENIGVNLKKRR